MNEEQQIKNKEFWDKQTQKLSNNHDEFMHKLLFRHIPVIVFLLLLLLILDKIGLGL